MAPFFTQANRNLAVTTPLGDDVLLLAGFSGTEQVSGLFHFELEMWSENAALSPEDIVGKSVTFEVRNPGENPRYFNGIVNRFSKGHRRDTLVLYRAEVVPWLWLLTRTTDCKIFQAMTAPDIIEAVFAEYGLTDYKTSGIAAAHPEYEYCVQYRETDFDFVSRLMEREGIFYYFEHAQDKHTLVLADGNAAFQDNPQNEVVHVYSESREQVTNRVAQWEHRYEYRSGKWSQSDYNFIDQPAGTAKTPSSLLMTETDSILKLDKIGKFERYDYPGDYQKKPDGLAYTKTHMEENETPYHQVLGGGSCGHFVPGTKIKMAQHDDAGEVGKSYILTSVSHQSQDKAVYRMTANSQDSGFRYSNQFVGIPLETPFRPPGDTPRPKIRGSQTAVVVGPSGEEIYPDKYGRVKVQFFWDRIGVRDDKSSCWIRVAQPSAGKNWGSMYIPRIGQEVVVSYLEGDPDRPLITGVVYNSDQMPAYTLPAEKTKSYIKTNSSKGGAGYNEIRFEDLADSEQIFVHAQKNMDVRVLNDSMEHVLNDRHMIVGEDGDDGKVGNQYEQVFVNKELNVKANQVEQIEGNVQWTVGKGAADDGGNVDLLIEKKKTELIEGDNEFHLKGDQKNKVDGTVSREIVTDLKEKVTGNDSLEVVGDRKVKIGGADSVDVAGARNQKVGGDDSLNITGTLHQKMGKAAGVQAGTDVYIKAGTNVVIEAGVQLTLKVGGNFVVIDASGVAIKGAMVQINSGGAAGSGSAPAPVAPVAPDAPIAPADAQQAAPTVPTDADDSQTGTKSAPDSLN